MNHLYNSCVEVLRMQTTMVNGRVRASYEVQPWPLSFVPCRLDLNFIRPGKDAPPVIEAGVMPDRFGILFCDAGTGLMAGDHVRTVPNENGDEPIKGTFELKAIPDEAIDFSSPHHIEVQITEVSQKALGQFPGRTNDPPQQ